jgi:hypothetical protein
MQRYLPARSVAGIIVACVLCLGCRGAPPPRPKAPPPKSKGDDLPEVSLQIPDEASPQTRPAMLARVYTLLRAKKATERAEAARVPGELGEQGKPARAAVYRALLEHNADVRVAAADALKSIDPKMQYLAVALATEDRPPPPRPAAKGGGARRGRRAGADRGDEGGRP